MDGISSNMSDNPAQPVFRMLRIFSRAYFFVKTDRCISCSCTKSLCWTFQTSYIRCQISGPTRFDPPSIRTSYSQAIPYLAIPAVCETYSLPYERLRELRFRPNSQLGATPVAIRCNFRNFLQRFHKSCVACQNFSLV